MNSIWQKNENTVFGSFRLKIALSVMNEWWYLYEDQTIPIEWYAIAHDGEFYPEDWRYTELNQFD